VNDEYLYRDFNGLDWNEIHQEYRQKIENGVNNQDYYLLLDEMIARLGDNHSMFLNPDQVEEEEAEYHGNLNYFGIGVLLVAIPERNRAVILAVFRSPADRAN
jgi:C-terminal processing protease CtpA/Prc